MNYNEWILSLIEQAPDPEVKKGFFGKLLGGKSSEKEGGFFSKYFN